MGTNVCVEMWWLREVDTPVQPLLNSHLSNTTDYFCYQLMCCVVYKKKRAHYSLQEHKLISFEGPIGTIQQCVAMATFVGQIHNIGTGQLSCLLLVLLTKPTLPSSSSNLTH